MMPSSSEKDDQSQRKIRVGCVGGGQLGRMMALEAPRLGIEMFFLDPKGKESPAGQVVSTNVMEGSLRDAEQVHKLYEIHECDVITTEIEHISVEALEKFETEHNVKVHPGSSVLKTIRDKYIQKQHFASSGIPVPPFCETPSVERIREAAAVLGLPLMLKSRRGGYDGRGNAVLKSLDGIPQALSKLGVKENDDGMDLYAEGWVEFDCEIAVMVIRSTGAAVTYPPVRAIQQDSICRVVLAPAPNLSTTRLSECRNLAQLAIDSLGEGACGAFGVELFVDTKGKVLLNEVAPRPHNTGHYTQDACAVSQFENHLRAICGLPLGSTEMIVEAAAMVNVLGAKSGTIEDTMKSCNLSMSIPRAVLHWYGKAGCSPGRKMGHINLTSNSHGEMESSLFSLLEAEGIPKSLLPSEPTPLVGVIMGSQSDLPTMSAAVDVLKRFQVPHEVDIVSAHRTPDKLVEYARTASSRGMRVLIAGAGGAAHLPGMVASMTPLPVIGVPVKTSTLNGVDSLYSIVQMPRGIPVATVAIGNAQNAGLLAVRILSTNRPDLRRQMKDYQDGLTDMVLDTSTRLLQLGSDEFLKQMENKSKSVNV